MADSQDAEQDTAFQQKLSYANIGSIFTDTKPRISQRLYQLEIQKSEDGVRAVMLMFQCGDLTHQRVWQR